MHCCAAAVPRHCIAHCRYADGDDKEALEKATVKLTDEEQAERDAAIAAGKSVVDFLNSRWVGACGWVPVGADGWVPCWLAGWVAGWLVVAIRLSFCRCAAVF